MIANRTRRAVVQSTGHSLPAKIVTNAELTQIVETSDEWIVQRTGIRQRRITSEEETTGTMSVLAAKEALANAGMTADELDLVIVATVTGDYLWPATACTVQDEIGAKNAAAFDLSAACAGFIYALSNASAMIETGQVNTALVIGSDCLSKQVDWTDRSTCILFGDASAGVILKAEDNTDRGIIETVLFSDGSGRQSISIEAGGCRYPWGAERTIPRKTTITMTGSEVYRFAVNAMGEACIKVLEKAGMQASDIDLFVPHQANLRIIDSAAKRLELPEEKVFINVDKYGNTSGASVPLALHEAVQEGRLKPGMVVMTVGFGAGLVWGANLIRW